MIATNATLKLHTLDQVKRAAIGAGSHWFDTDSMRYFNSRLGQTVYPIPGGALFISSERFDYNSPRAYSVRSCTWNGCIDTVGEFQQYATSTSAHSAASRLVKSGFSLAA
jgi:hypothetical protein